LDVEYSELLENCEHCFACIGLINKKFCIFNTQYSEEDYWPLVDQIKTAMLKRNEYGRFFPYSCSGFAYNVSHASTFNHLDEAETLRLGGRWYNFPDATGEALPIKSLPLLLGETGDEVLKQTYRCPKTGRAIRFVKPELEFHRVVGIALPRVHSTLRRKTRMQEGFPLNLWKRACTECGVLLQTRIPKEYPAPILCDHCFETALLAST
jgi:hypothetical protein